SGGNRVEGPARLWVYHEAFHGAGTEPPGPTRRQGGERMPRVHPLPTVVWDHLLRQPGRCLVMRPVVLSLLVRDFRSAAGSNGEPGHGGGRSSQNPTAGHRGNQGGQRGGGMAPLSHPSLKLVQELRTRNERVRAPRLEEGSGTGQILFIETEIGPDRGVALGGQIVEKLGKALQLVTHRRTHPDEASRRASERGVAVL